jgi:hypothetical protein
LSPTAKHLVAVGHETAERMLVPFGSRCLLQILPPSVVTTMPALKVGMPRFSPVLYPVAQQRVVVGQEMARKWCRPPNAASEVHVLPPVVLATIAPPSEAVVPTAQQSELVGQDNPATSSIVGG